MPGWATNNNTAATSCSACEAGRYSTEGNNAGADACEPCPAGQFQIASGQTGCNDCPLNQFQAEPGQYLCQVSDFPAGPRNSFQPHSTNIDENTTPRAGLRGDGRRRVRSRRGVVLLRHLPGDVLLTGRDRAVRAVRRRLQQVMTTTPKLTITIILNRNVPLRKRTPYPRTAGTTARQAA